MMKLEKRIRSGKEKSPVENYSVIFFFAGHGVLYDGMQALLLNEFNERQPFYNMYMAEKEIRRIAEANENSYVIAMFACCR